MNKLMKLEKGVIEGFFGQEWSHHDRIEHCKFLTGANYQFYIYAPKSDSNLRGQWLLDWPNNRWQQLLELRQQCKTSNIKFGIGLSPFELHLNFDACGQKQLKAKIERINELTPDIACILFDDMRGDKADLATVQAEITDCIYKHSNAKHFIICPSYYSEDPILDKVFGKRPDNYLEDLGRLVAPDIDIFWTGSRVCSESFSDKEIEVVTKKLRRKPFLWDNYPVNDGAKLCNHLHLCGFANRSNLSIKNISGHAINPMNQAWLSRIPLATLPAMYDAKKDTAVETQKAIYSQCPSDLAAQLSRNLKTFNKEGLSQIDKDERVKLIGIYKQLPHTPFAREVIEWLEGKYAFDPNCLTD